MFLFLGALCGAAAVALGAFGAHVLKARLGADAISHWHTASEYLFWHALALLAVGLTKTQPGGWLKPSGWLLVAGVALFSGSLYALALGAPSALGMVTPLGGVALLLGWIFFAVAVWRG